MNSLVAALADRYRIERELGSGGMATVFLAQDLRHDRKVAIKVLRPELAAVIGAARFLVEIKTTANLQHPHILSLHDSGEVEGTVFYVMPFIAGESLRDRLTRDKQLPVNEALLIATEVADALEYAHRHGVIHRDIKPENILLQGGHALVADFGIALAAARTEGGSRMTETGMSLGTPHYMSPEQAMGEREITARTDVYALGCVLYEMLTAEPPFTGATAQAIVARVMTEEPRSLTLQRRTIPRHVDAAVRVALSKVPADRFATAKAFAEALADPRFGETGSTDGVAGPGRRRRFAVAGWAAAGIAAAGLAGGYLLGRAGTPEPTAQPLQFTIELPDSISSVNRCCGRAQVLSPDGSTLVYVGIRGTRGALWRRSLDRLESEIIPGTEEASIPFMSPDGQWLAFEAGGRLKKVAMSGGPATPIATAQQVSGASWGEGDVIVFSRDGRLWTVPAAGGEPKVLTTPDSSTVHRYPFMLPGGKAALFTMRPREGALDALRIGVVDLGSGKIDTLGFGVRAEYVDGYLVFSGADHTLLAQPFDVGRRQTTGPAVALFGGLALHGGTNHEFSFSGNGWLSYQPGRGAAGGEVLRAVGPGTQRVISLPGRENANFEDPAFSPDGSRLAIGVIPAGGAGPDLDLWLFDLKAQTLNRLTVGGGGAPVWSQDGRRIAYSVQNNRNIPNGIYVRSADQTGSPELILAGSTIFPGSWLPDGRSLVFGATFRPGTRHDIGIITLGDSAPRWLISTEADEVHPQLSPDGRWLAYRSGLGGGGEVYVKPMVGEGAPVQVSADGGGSPRWSADGKTLYYLVPGAIEAAAVAAGPGFAVASRRKVAGVESPDLNIATVNWALFPNGREFLFIDVGQLGTPRIVVVKSWLELVRSKSAPR
jgi:serine/threonine-protein kinase